MEMTVAKLESRNALPKGIADHLRQSIKLSKKAETGTAESGSTRRAEAALKRAERLFAKGRLSEVSITRIAEGLQEAYGKARRAYRQAYEKPSDDAFHAWRKATQAHWRHMQLLSRGWPEAISARVSSAKELSRLLGEDHDLSVLLAFIQSSDCAGLSASDVSALTTSCLDWQREIRRHAKPYAERLYADRPRHLAEHIVGYWTAAGELAKLAALECPGQERTQARLVSRRRGKLSSSDVQGPATGSRHTMQRRKKLMTSE
jgi:hypothetical protein